MTDEQINAAIAEACGWKPHADGMHYYKGKHLLWRTRKDLPSYCNDLNAMHEAEKTLMSEQSLNYKTRLMKTELWYYKATARQRAEAFLRTLGKWEEAVVKESFTTEEEK
jgi:hypothetical protein